MEDRHKLLARKALKFSLTSFLEELVHLSPNAQLDAIHFFSPQIDPIQNLLIAQKKCFSDLKLKLLQTNMKTYMWCVFPNVRHLPGAPWCRLTPPKNLPH